MKDTGLVLCGGGGKGAYQIGVWKAMREKGIEDEFCAVSGVSVGALNGALFCLGDLELAEETWKEVSPDKFLSPTAYENGDNGFFTRDGLVEMIQKLDYTDIVNWRKLFAVSYNIDKKKAEYFLLNTLPKEKIEDILLATSAIPAIYSSVLINGSHYVDGGVKDSAPVKPLRDIGIEKILIVSLESSFNSNKIHHKYPNCFFKIIKPSVDIGRYISALDFSREGINTRMEIGYNDAMRFFDDKEAPLPKAEDQLNRIQGDIKTLMNILFRTAGDLEMFTNFTDNIPKVEIPKVEIPKLEDIIDDIELNMFKDVFEIDGWRLQQHKILKGHYRILDKDGVRRAAFKDPNVFFQTLEKYKKDA